MQHDTRLIAAPECRFAIRFDTTVIRDSIPLAVCGVYLLTKGEAPLYVGRSDASLRRRLLMHELLGTATHFLWQITRNPVQAYYHECAWFHSLQHCELWNVAHPGRPRGRRLVCPFCLPAGGVRLRLLWEQSTTSNQFSPDARCVESHS